MSDRPLDERFLREQFSRRLRWLNPPLSWKVEPSLPALVVEPAAKTDFRQQTHYGFCADNGHFLHLDVGGLFTLTTKVRFHPAHQYDQAGLMVRRGPSCWIKTSVEYEPNGPSQLGAVVTNQGFSDWSMQDFPPGRKRSSPESSPQSRQPAGRMGARRGRTLEAASRRPSPRFGGRAAAVRFVCTQSQRRRLSS